MDFLGLFGDGVFLGALSKVFEGEVAKNTIAFLIAAYLHRGWVKKDMAEHFKKLTESIEHVAKAMSSRMDGIDRRVETLETRVHSKDSTT